MPRYETRIWEGMQEKEADIWLQTRLTDECTLIGARLVSLVPWRTRGNEMYQVTTAVLAVLEFPDHPV